MRISDWSSDVCSSDLDRVVERVGRGAVDLGDGIDVARHGAVPPLPLPVFPTATAARRAGSRPLLPATSGARAATGGGEERCPAAGVDPGNREILASEVARMIRSLKELSHYDIAARDGSLGDVHDVFFDDHSWPEIGRAHV